MLITLVMTPAYDPSTLGSYWPGAGPDDWAAEVVAKTPRTSNDSARLLIMTAPPARQLPLAARGSVPWPPTREKRATNREPYQDPGDAYRTAPPRENFQSPRRRGRGSRRRAADSGSRRTCPRALPGCGAAGRPTTRARCP